MNTSTTASQAVHTLHSSVRNEDKSVSTVPKGTVHLHLLRTLETELQEQQLIDETHDILNPLWFLAETERNVYLWRSGYSLEQEDEFEFWIDIPALIKKRMEQLRSFDSENPFLNPLWGLSIADKAMRDKEMNYLKSLFELIDGIKVHLEALCVAASKVSHNLIPNSDEKEIVVLPQAKPSLEIARKAISKLDTKYYAKNMTY